MHCSFPKTSAITEVAGELLDYVQRIYTFGGKNLEPFQMLNIKLFLSIYS